MALADFDNLFDWLPNTCFMIGCHQDHQAGVIADVISDIAEINGALLADGDPFHIDTLLSQLAGRFSDAGVLNPGDQQVVARLTCESPQGQIVCFRGTTRQHDIICAKLAADNVPGVLQGKAGALPGTVLAGCVHIAITQALSEHRSNPWVDWRGGVVIEIDVVHIFRSRQEAVHCHAGRIRLARGSNDGNLRSYRSERIHLDTSRKLKDDLVLRMASGFTMRTKKTAPAIQLKSAARRYRLDRPHMRRRQRGLPSQQLAEKEITAPADGVQHAGISEGAHERIGRLEGILFIAREALSSRKISELAGLADGTEARTLIRHLNEMYDKQGRAIHIEQVAGGYQLMTRPGVGRWVKRLDHVPAAIRLSQPAMETLAVVAYRQPALRVEVEAVRGVACSEVLRQLLERGLVRIAGRSEELGRPYLYGTTPAFLAAFGLPTLESLPAVAGVDMPAIPSSETAS